MTISNKSQGNYVNLLKLKADKIFQNKNLNVVLNDDIWGEDTLLLRSGRYLNEDLINKLLNFGIKNINVNFVEKNEDVKEQEFVVNEFIKNQNVLIVEKNILNTAWFVRNLIDIGFSEGNILITGDYNFINQYFRVKKINFIFIGLPLYEKCIKCINKYSLLRHTHAFVIMESRDSLRKIENNYSSEVKFLRKPLSSKTFNALINRALSTNLLDFYTEETNVC